MLVGDLFLPNKVSAESSFNFLEKRNSANIVKDKTYFKNLDNPTCTDLFITNRPRCFKNTTAFSTGLSDFLKIAFTVLKTSFSKAPPKEMFYRDYKIFEPNKIKYELKHRIQSESIEFYSEFEIVFVDIFHR